MSNRKTVISLSGVGGTGKTTLSHSLHNKLLMMGLSAIFVPSITREYYESKGVLNEEAFSKLSRIEKTQFQIGLFNEFVYRAKRAVETAEGEAYLIFDRSAIDYFCYTLLSCNESIIKEELIKLRDDMYAFEDMGDYNYNYYLPFPVPWEKEAVDGFRDRCYAKDYALDSLTYDTCVKRRHIYRGVVPLNSVDNRTAHIVNDLRENLGVTA
jgi:predicted ATPase